MSAVRLREADLDALQHERLPLPAEPTATRSEREPHRDPSAWWKSAEAAAAQEAHIKAMFAEPLRQIPQDLPLTARNLLIGLVIVLIAVGISALWPMGFAHG